jgi:hypothetical protein
MEEYPSLRQICRHNLPHAQSIPKDSRSALVRLSSLVFCLLDLQVQVRASLRRHQAATLVQQKALAGKYDE